MQQNKMIGLGALAILAGLAWFQKKSAATTSATVSKLGETSQSNFAANLFNALTPTPSSNTAKAQAATVLDSHPASVGPVLVAGPAPSAPIKMSAADINANVNRIGVADDAAVFQLADWGRQNNVSINDFSAATGYLPNDVANVFAKRGILYGF